IRIDRRARSRRRAVVGGPLSGREPRRDGSTPDLGNVDRNAAMPRANDEHAWATAEAAVRRSYGKLVAYLAGRTRDVAGAEDALSDAFAAALLDWPKHGVPERPEAWLMAVARRKAIDAARRRRSRVEAADHLRLISDELRQLADTDGSDIPDDR